MTVIAALVILFVALILIGLAWWVAGQLAPLITPYLPAFIVRLLYVLAVVIMVLIILGVLLYVLSALGVPVPHWALLR